MRFKNFRVRHVLFVALIVPFGGLIGCLELEDIILDPVRELSETPAIYSLPYETVELRVQEERTIVLWHVRAELSEGLVLVVPGSDENKSAYLPVLSVFVPNGYDVVLMDYAGFGDSTGEAQLSNFVADARAALRYAQSQNTNVILMGASLGTPVAVRLAAETQVNALILEGTVVLDDQVAVWLNEHGYGNRVLIEILEAMTADKIPSDYDILRYIREVNTRILFLHSKQDEVTPYENARRVYRTASQPVDFRDLDYKHGQMIKRDHDRYIAMILSWLRKDARVAAQLESL